jgi:hypothetical protein
MRYRLVVLPFMGRYHITLVEWEPNGEEFAKHSRFYDVGPEHCDVTSLASVLQWLSWNLSKPAP